MATFSITSGLEEGTLVFSCEERCFSLDVISRMMVQYAHHYVYDHDVQMGMNVQLMDTIYVHTRTKLHYKIVFEKMEQLNEPQR